MKRLATLAAMAAMLLTALAPTALAAGPTRHIEQANLRKIDTSFRPYLADTKRKVTVVLQLDGKPAIVGTGLSGAERKAHAKSLRATQGRLDGRIRSLGGKVLHRYQYAYNGITVRTTGNRLAALAALPGVVAVRRLQLFTRDNIRAVPYVGAPTAWQSTGVTGAGETIAVIDSGIDYTHANFGGPGTPAAYNANNPTVIEPGSFPTAKVVAGYDFVGDAYDGSGDLGSPTPAPDPDPLDCGDGHGSHVAGTAAGEGVRANHTTYSGPYTPALYANPGAFVIGPGVAPEAKLIALKIFGCQGSASSDVIVDALEWVAAYNVSHADGIDVVNMSLGHPFGTSTDPDVVAVNNLVDTGVVVVAAAGNEGPVPFIAGGPAVATKAISVAALDAFPVIPLAAVDMPSGPDIHGNNQSAYPAFPVTGKLRVISDGAGGVSTGCTAGAYGAASAGKIVAIKRGDCAFVDKGAAAQAAGAIGIVDINRDDSAPGELPTFNGYTPNFFTIPMVGVARSAQSTLQAANGATITLKANGTMPNPANQQIVDFSSEGPRFGDNALKPDVTAPGDYLTSTAVATGWNGTSYSGTSMASPMTAGTAALVREAHPSWSPLKVKAAIVNTADATSASILDYDPLRAGSGVVQANRAAATRAVATTSDRTASLSFGYEQSTGRISDSKEITLWNAGGTDVWYTLTASSPLVGIKPSVVKVRAHDSRTVRVRASLSRDEVAALPTADQYLSGNFGALDSMSGAVTATPNTSMPGYYPLRVPYLLVPRGLSDVEADLGKATAVGDNLTADLHLRNGGGHSGIADIYALGVTDAHGDGTNGTDLRAVGVQSIPASVLTGVDDPTDRGIQFAINSWDRFSTESPNEIDVAVDTNGDGDPDRFVVGIDDGLIFAGANDGIFLSLIFDADFNLIDGWLADAPLNGSTLILPALASDLGLADGSGSFTYSVVAFDGVSGGADETDLSVPFDAFAPAQSTGDFVELASHDRLTLPAWANAASVKDGTVAGWMVVTLDDRNGLAQANLVGFRHGHRHWWHPHHR